MATGSDDAFSTSCRKSSPHSNPTNPWHFFGLLNFRGTSVQSQQTAISGSRNCRPEMNVLSIMGDKSPKATNKHAAQKQAKTNTNTRKKNDAAAAKQVVKTKK
jgi:hypothetical protein